jgi:hypothetical protein
MMFDLKKDQYIFSYETLNKNMEIACKISCPCACINCIYVLMLLLCYPNINFIQLICNNCNNMCITSSFKLEINKNISKYVELVFIKKKIKKN